MTLTKRAVVAPPGAICFACNQSFEGNPVAFSFETDDLLPPPQASELHGLVFHKGHLLHYARRRGWEAVVAFVASAGPSNF
ncbi:MAG TPA: hypothetical protein VFG07_05015 [Thermoplasmata archaeon]|nr:hypothetical protein [Thermoplasmata archaeon]